ncbi:MAG: alkaline phosphatase family protein [Acidobacteriota bacterium]|nr:alkaline phosphatase family protein [Acidobacteriota bacterium]
MRGVTYRQVWIDAMMTGAAAGLVAEALVLRMNPEVTQEMRGVIVGMPLWASWGMLMIGVPLLIILAIVQRIRPRTDRWLTPQLTAAIFAVGSVLSAVNARFHVHLLQGSAHRVLVQDAVAWALAAILALTGGWLVRRAGSGQNLRIVLSVIVLMLPVLRVVGVPTPPRQYLEVAAKPLGTPTRPLLVIGLEGLDSKFLLTDAIGSNLPTLARLREDGSWARIEPHRPYLRWALWTSVATGTYPGQHGVKAHWGWDLPIVFPKTLRLLPWTPEGSRVILPWGLAERVPPPPTTVAPLWARLEASDVSTDVFGWPGSWGDDPSLRPTPLFDRGGLLEPSMNASLEAALAPFPERRLQIWEAIVRDQTRIDEAREGLAAGVEDVWIHLETLALVRRFHEPLRRRHTRERRLMELVMELLDQQLGLLLDATREESVVAVVSPYGFAPPGSFERMKRLFGGGGKWQTSAESCPDGLLVVFGDGVDGAIRGPRATPPDIAPTLCYLLGLPVAQYMEGSVLVDIIEPAFLTENPLRVVD